MHVQKKVAVSQLTTPRSHTLNGANIVLSGLVPLGIEVARYITRSFPHLSHLKQSHHHTIKFIFNREMRKANKHRSELGLQAVAFGAKLQTRINRQVTHLVVSETRTRTQKVRHASKYPHIKVVKSQWLTDCMTRWELLDENPYLVCNIFYYEDPTFYIEWRHIPYLGALCWGVWYSYTEEYDWLAFRLLEACIRPLTKMETAHQQCLIEGRVWLTDWQVNLHPEDKLKGQESDFSHMSTDASEDESVGTDESAEVEDVDGDAPEPLEEGQSPIESLKEIDWSGVDDELKDFLGSDADDSSDEGSVTSSKLNHLIHAPNSVLMNTDTSESNKEPRSASKRKYHTDSEDPSDEEVESKLAKKQRVAKARTTSLKTVANTSSESPSKNGESNAAAADDEPVSETDTDDAVLQAEMEAELMAEFGFGGDDDDQV